MLAKFHFQHLKRKLLIFLGVFGPATITAMADNDAAGVATYSLAGAQFGYGILFILLVVTLLLAVTQEMGVRIAIVTGKGLGALIRERYGIRVALFVFLGLGVANFGTIVANFAALKAVAAMFNLNILPGIIFFIILAFIFVAKGSYKTNQNIFLFASLFYLSYIISAIKAGPDWGQALVNLTTPVGIKFDYRFIFASIAVLGTTITPWGQFFINSYVVDKKLGIDKLPYERLETYAGAVLTDLFSFFMIVATAATLFVHGIPLVSGEQAAIAIQPFAGELAGILFALGLLNAGFMGMVIVSLSTAYAFAEFFGLEGSLDVSFERGRLFYVLFLSQLVLAGIVVLLPGVSLFQIVFYTQSLNGFLLPVIFYFLLCIINDKTLMGSHTNSRFFNWIAIGASVAIIAAALFTVVGSIAQFI